MGEAIAALVEAVVWLVLAFVEALPIVIELLVTVAIAALTLIAYAVSPRFRRRKRQQWAAKPRKKYVDLGLSSACLILLIGLGVWLAWPASKPDNEPVLITDGSIAEFHLKLEKAGAEKATQVHIAVKKGGTKASIETGSLRELGKAIRANVTVIHPPKEMERNGSTNESANAK